MEYVSINLWAANLQPVVSDLQTWLARLEALVAQTAARGGYMLVLPEFACAQWLSFTPIDMPYSKYHGLAVRIRSGSAGCNCCNVRAVWRLNTCRNDTIPG